MAELIKKEINILKSLSHENVVKLYNLIKKDNRLVGFTMEYCGKSLRYLITNKESIPSFWIKDIINALSYLETINIIHADIKPENILISNNAKLIDFGSSIINNNYENIQIPIFYAAPEYIKDKIVTSKIDVFSLGICIWESVTGHCAYEDLPPPIIKKKILNYDFEDIPKNIDKIIFDIITLCRKPYDKRPFAKELMNMFDF